MAGQELDRLTDQSLTDEERERRKRLAYKGAVRVPWFTWWSAEAEAVTAALGKSKGVPARELWGGLDGKTYPEHWRKRAEEMRLLAGQIKDEISKQAMLKIAADYDRLSQRAEQRAHGFRPAWSGETFGLSNEPRSVRPVAGRAGGGAGDAMSDVA
jgi:hypothetical protein